MFSLIFFNKKHKSSIMNYQKKITLLILVFSYLLAYSQTEPLQFIGKYKPDVMILGVFHFGDSNDSYQSSEKLDVLSPKSQQEIDSVLYKISLFKPTKILIETDRIINSRYKEYFEGRFDISFKPNEIYQLAFKLGKLLHHDKIFCSDASAEWFGTKDIDWDNFDEEAYLKSKSQYNKTERYDFTDFYKETDTLKFKMSIGEYLSYLNHHETSLKYHQTWLTNIVLCGAGDNYYGADSVGKWYRRNLRIFSNLYDYANFDEEERILLIYGASHVWTLSQFISDSPDFNYINVNDYLKF